MRYVIGMIVLIVATLLPGTSRAEPIAAYAGYAIENLLDVPSTEPLTVREVISASPTDCQMHSLRQTALTLPMDYGTQWVWADLSKASGMYFPRTATIALSVHTDCKWIPIVVAHEWSHHFQEIVGYADKRKVNDIPYKEIVAECLARMLIPAPYFEGYPEWAGTGCNAMFNRMASDLLQTI